MKKTILLSCLPSVVFAQVGSGSDSNFMEFIIVTVVAVVLFFVFRQLMLWYWKVDISIKNQEETNRLLKEISAKLHETRRVENQQD